MPDGHKGHNGCGCYPLIYQKQEIVRPSVSSHGHAAVLAYLTLGLMIMDPRDNPCTILNSTSPIFGLFIVLGGGGGGGSLFYFGSFAKSDTKL